MRTTLVILSAILVAFSSVGAGAGERDSTTALVEQVAVQRELARATAPVRNVAEFRRYLKEHQGPSSPFQGLSRGALARFSNSPTFTDRGLASFDYTDLRRELTASQIHALLRVFGVEDVAGQIPGLNVRTRTDQLVVQPMAAHNGHHDMYCSSRATCAPASGLVCTSNC